MLEFHVGNLYTKVSKNLATKEELHKIHDILSVRIEGYYFSRKFKRGLWDGYKRFFNLLTCTFYTGLLSQVISQLDGIPYKVIDDRVPHPHLNVPLSLNGIDLRSYQINMIEEAVKHGRGIISAPPNAGKTEVACGIMQVLGLPTNFFTHRIALLEQTKKRIEKRLGVRVGTVAQGVEDIRDINVLSVASVHKRLDSPSVKELLERTPVVISDEVHHISASTWEKCLKACKGAYYRYGLSATALLRDDISNMVVKGLTGDEIASISNKDLIELGISALPSVYLMSVNNPKIPTHFTFDMAYDEGILFNTYRNELIISSTRRFLEMGKSVFILVWRIPHGELLYNRFRELGVDCEFISGERKTIPISDALERFDNKSLKCLISSTISDEGLDVPAMDVLIIGVGFKAPLKTIQRVGRGLRKKKEGENVVTIVDFVDWHDKRYLLKHSKDRCREYYKMGIQMFEVVDNDWTKIEER